MNVLGKIIGGVAGFAMGGPFGAILGATLGHAADTGLPPKFGFSFDGQSNAASLAARLGTRDQVFAVCIVALAAKLAKCDGTVKRSEIDAFRQVFRIPPEAVRDIGRLFDEARDSADGFEEFADRLGRLFADNRGMLEDVLAALFTIARADGPANNAEATFLSRTATGFGLDQNGWNRVRNAAARPASVEPSPYDLFGLPPSAADDDIRARWKQLMRENHPDGLAARGVPAEFVARATEKVARINAAWDRIKRERGL
ncbi:MAG: molecular chaperone DjlA [Acetobacteraceae bacterium]|nr:molecular chaperone DjlA [Acetobacteraceae bacterium]MSP30044.1 molecular chaperone DjlA [Acetobacteraceae bacterium]